MVDYCNWSCIAWRWAGEKGEGGLNEVVELFIPDGFWFIDMFMAVYSLKDCSLMVCSLSYYAVGGMTCCG